MRQAATLAILTAASTAFTGCAFVGGAADTVWSGTKSAARFVATPVRALRGAPDAEIQYAEVPVSEPVASVQTETYSPVYALAFDPTFDPGAEYWAVRGEAAGDELPTARIDTADSLAFVRLNGQSDINDWRTCENIHRGYWMVDAAGGRINPDFEVCLRNKGYVRESELAFYGTGDTGVVRGSDVQTRRTGYTQGGYTPLP